jgi:hypothetical protein
MSFGGHVQDMINRMKNNAAMKTSRRNKFEKSKLGLVDFKYKKTEYNLPELSDDELQKLRIKLQQEAKEERKKQLIIWSIVLILPLIIILIVINFLTF